MTTPTTTPTVETIVLDPMLYQVLKKRHGEGGDDAVKQHATLASQVYPIGAEVITASFISMRKAEQEREALDAKNARINAKSGKCQEFISLVKSFTPNKSFIDLMEKGQKLCASLSDDDSKVSFSVVINYSEDGKALVITPSFTGITPGAAKRTTTNTTGGDGKSDKSRISPWAAYQRGVEKGDAFVIKKVSKGTFRDETKGQDIPPKGMTKWIRDNYPNSNTANILREYKQL